MDTASPPAAKKRHLLTKLARDSGTVMVGFVMVVVAFYGMRRLDPGATVDGLGGLFVALNTALIGFATASLAAMIRWLLFYPLRKREEEQHLVGDKTTVLGLCAVALDRLTWFAIWFVLFSRAVGQ